MADEMVKWSSREGYIAYTREIALQTLVEDLPIVAEAYGIEAGEIPNDRDHEYDAAHKYKWIAEIIHNIREQIKPTPQSTPIEDVTAESEPVDLSELTVKELKERAEEQGLEVPAHPKKADLIELLADEK